MQLLSIIVQVGRVIPPRLVAVSKNQSVEKVQWAYQEGLRHFGENYVSAVNVPHNMDVNISAKTMRETSDVIKPFRTTY